jgi:copper chaperone CopZ
MGIAAKTEANAKKAVIMPNVPIAKSARTANVLIAVKTAFALQAKTAVRKPDHSILLNTEERFNNRSLPIFFYMRRLFIIVMISVFALPAIGQINSAKLQASGLTCAMCARAVYKNLEALPFVETIDTDLNGSAFLLDFKKDKLLDFDAIRKKVEDAGFSVATLDITADFSEVNIKPDLHINYGGMVFHFLGVKEQVITGSKTVRVVDRNFVGSKDQKKYQGMTAMECYKTGTVSSCCERNGIITPARVYHVTL